MTETHCTDANWRASSVGDNLKIGLAIHNS